MSAAIDFRYLLDAKQDDERQAEIRSHLRALLQKLADKQVKSS
jgi:hypothetical protein